MFDVIEHPDVILVVVFALMFMLCLGKVWIEHGDSAREKSAEVRSHRDALQQEYVRMMAETESILMGMFESSANLAEWNFDAKRREFERFLEHVKDHPERLFGSKSTKSQQKRAVAPFRRFLIHWLSVFEQCSVDPIRKPNVILSDWELESCASVSELADLVGNRLARNEVNFLQLMQKAVKKIQYKMEKAGPKAAAGWIQFGCVGFGVHPRPLDAPEPREPASADGPSILDGDDDAEEKAPVPRKQAGPPKKKGRKQVQEEEEDADAYPIDIALGCVMVTILSQAHSMVFLSLFVGLVVMSLEISLKRHFFILLVSIAVVSLMLMLYSIKDLDEMARLVQEVHELEQAHNKVQEHHRKLDAFCTKLQRVGHLWKCRTMPCLDFLGELHREVWDIGDEDKLELLEAVAARLDDILPGMGPLKLWCCEALDEDDGVKVMDVGPEILKLASEQLSGCTAYIEHHRADPRAASLILKRMGRPFGFLICRILRAHNLTNKAGLVGVIGELANPYARLATNGGNAVRTAVVQQSLDPVWAEEFFIPVHWEDSKLELHVFTENKLGGEDQSLGYVLIDFRSQTPGMWHKARQHLMSVKKKTQKKSELEYELYFAVEVRQLFFVDAAPPANSRNQRLSDFLGQL